MIRRLRFVGKLEASFGRPAPNRALVVQAYSLAERQWVPLAEVKTQSDGAFAGVIDANVLGQAQFAPVLGLSDANAKNVVPVGAPFTWSRGTLSVAFGTVQVPESIEKPRIDVLDPKVSEEVTRLKVRVLELEVELNETRARLDVATKARAEVEAERDKLRLELDQIRNSEEASPLISDLAAKVASSLGQATPQEGPDGFRLGEAKVTLKGYLTDGGNRFKPLDAAEVASASSSAASEISFNLQSSSEAEATAQVMPDLRGVTASTARRVLRPLGTEVQLVETIGTPRGAVIGQHPSPGSELPRGTTVRLEIAIGSGEE